MNINKMKLTVRDIVTILLVIFILLSIRDYNRTQRRNKYREQSTESIKEYKEEEKEDIPDNTNKVSEDNDLFYIVGLDNVSQEDLEYTKKIIEDFYGYHCVIRESVLISNESFLDRENKINAFDCVNKLETNNKTLYLTYMSLVDDGVDLRGFTTINGKTLIVKSDRSFMKGTIIHEIGHTLGLEHCLDLTCIMAINNDEYDSGDFCQSCKRIVGR